MDLTEATAQLQQQTGIIAASDAATAIGGGSISATYRVPSKDGPLFLKLGPAGSYELLAAEVDGLRALRECGALTVPTVYCHGRTESSSYLFLEWLELGARSAAAETNLGRALALQHRTTASNFGWARSNYIGATYQPNDQYDNWLVFWREKRLRFQLDLASRNGLPAADQAAAYAVLDGLEHFFGDDEIVPSLLHGDLWSGNWGEISAGEPCIFDPAVYCGDREADLAMTRLFGGFSGAFYDAYMTEWPLRAGWEDRVDLYNIYHLLNHFNLFGRGYLPQVSGALTRLVERA